MRKTFRWFFLGKKSFFRFLVETSSDVRKKLYRNVVKNEFYLFRKPIDETDFFDFSNVFDTYSDFWGIFLWLLANKISRKLVKTAFYRFREYTWMKNNSFWKILFRLTSELRAKLLLTVDKTFTERLSKLFSTCSGNKLKKQIFHNFFGFYVYSDFKRNIFRLLEISLCKVIKTDFFEFSRTLW